MASKSLSNIVYCNPDVAPGNTTPLCPECKIWMDFIVYSYKPTKIRVKNIHEEYINYVRYQCGKCEKYMITCWECGFEKTKEKDSHNRHENILLMVSVQKHEPFDSSKSHDSKKIFHCPIECHKKCVIYVLPCDICAKQ